MTGWAWFETHGGELEQALASLRTHEQRLLDWGRELAGVLDRGGRLLAAGNGGSAAEAQHLTAELVGRFVDERRPLSAIALAAETSSLTAIVNDYGIDAMFARQVQAHGRAGDVLVLLSTSGRSPNVLQAAERARELGIRTWALTGPGPNPLTERCDDAVAIDAPSTSAVQTAHLVAVHALCAAVDEVLVPAAERRTAIAAGARAVASPPRTATPAAAAPVPGAGAGSGTAAPVVRSGVTDPFAVPGPVPEPRAAEQARPSGPSAASPSAASDAAPDAPLPDAAPHVVVVGDVVLDRDVDGRTERISPDAPVPVVDVTAVRESPGGAGLTALLCAASGARVTLVAPLAEDTGGRRLRDELAAGGVAVVGLGHEGGTRTKTRVRSAGQSVVRVDDGGPGAPAPVDGELAAVEAALAAADVVLVSDYGAGVTRHPEVRRLLGAAAARTHVVWDPHPRGGDPVPRCVLVTPNLAEAAAAVARAGGAATGGRHPDELAVRLRTELSATGVCVTAGEAGAYLALAGSDPLFVPAAAVTGGDPCGAGDRFAATAAVALARGAVLSEAVQRAVGEASAWVATGGADGFRRRRDEAPVRVGSGPDGGGPDGGSAGLPVGVASVAGLPGIDAPADGPDEVRRLGDRLRLRGTVVATGGCFDIVHPGHVATLQAARRLGDALVVVINSDESVRRLKGPDRPVVGVEDRARVLRAFDCVDAVVVFDEDDPRQVLDLLRPDVWAKGGDYGATPLVESGTVRRHGGRVVLLPYLDGRSTTGILQRSRAAGDARPAVPAAPPE
ncbi:PfkB family carbohydrate kinase [Nakamurella endophytica]|uniref:SIS domain-containing protein n=1 Tax=Nakamurella endophytica TaxID=1748367 RepID=A0A917T3L1_9ACTN|nr:PfkB family carbohydrate kinase [Nakamurella endophytica]GGM08173.1 hypothetical protein GCM10011594_30200 [Nakamurella endophytica]